VPIKISAADTWFSRCVREAAGWACQRCGAQHQEGSMGLHCAHYMSRGKWATRFDPMNVAALCYGCHSYIDRNPHFKTAWFEDYHGHSVCAIMREKSENTRHGLKKLKREIAAHYRAELVRIKQARSEGVNYLIEGFA
jgi:hypothetical protein